MGGALDDLDRRLDQERAMAQQKKLIEAQEKAKKAAEKAKKQQSDNSSLLW